MKKENQSPKKRLRRSAEVIAELILEAERTGNVSEICRRESIAPAQMYRWRVKFKEGAIEALKKNTRRSKEIDSEKEQLKSELAKAKEALCDSTIELQLLKKNVYSD